MIYDILCYMIWYMIIHTQGPMNEGFIMNPYDPHVANKDTPGGQMIVLENLEVLCKDTFLK